MISNLDGEMKITGRDQNWIASYDPGQTMGPAVFEAYGSPVLDSVRCKFGDLDESLALVDNARLFRKGVAAVASTRGRLPFGAGVSFAHTHRFTEHAARIVTDVRIPPGTQLTGALEIDSITLPGAFQQCRVLAANHVLSDWKDLDGDGLTWTHHPLAILLRREDGFILEIGAGFDLWRWSAGVIPDAPSAIFSLRRTEQGVEFSRKITVTDSAVGLKPRDYRFTWYLAWGKASESGDQPTDGQTAPWKADGELDVQALRETLKSGSPSMLVIDLVQPYWPEALLHAGEAGPCFCSRGVNKRLRRVVRQLIDVLPADCPVAFSGLTPSQCNVGRHAERRQPTNHWDLTGILEFAVWTRQRMGPDRQLLNISPDLGLLSLARLFALPDHDLDQIEYEWDPPEATD